MKTHDESSVISEFPFLYPIIGILPSPCGFFEVRGRLPDLLTNLSAPG
jgi:hypothetical protein